MVQAEKLALSRINQRESNYRVIIMSVKNGGFALCMSYGKGGIRYVNIR